MKKYENIENKYYMKYKSNIEELDRFYKSINAENVNQNVLEEQYKALNTRLLVFKEFADNKRRCRSLLYLIIYILIETILQLKIPEKKMKY